MTFPVLFFLSVAVAFQSAVDDWGFFGHKRINHMAVFTLPPALIGVYKSNIDYITQHAVDPDKRRYAVRQEAPRHYIDLDTWGDFPFENLPRSFPAALAAHLVLFSLHDGDTVEIHIPAQQRQGIWLRSIGMKVYYEGLETISSDSLLQYLDSVNVGSEEAIQLADGLSPHGIVPYHLISAQKRLTEAFRAGDVQAILKRSADLGHYIADAHVPLHTTSNYNGQLTGQDGIHAFWESRVPELFAEDYDYLVGRAEYIDDKTDYFWNIVFESHALVDEVLSSEAEISRAFSGQRFAVDARGSATVLQPSREYTAAYSKRLRGMVEKRMRKAIHAVGSSWYTAWVDAGKPELSLVKTETAIRQLDSLDRAFSAREPLGRWHAVD